MALEDAQEKTMPLLALEIDKAMELITSGADARISAAEGWTALHVATELGHDAPVVALLANGARANVVAVTKGVSPLRVAARAGHVDAVARLLAAGADVRARSAT